VNSVLKGYDLSKLAVLIVEKERSMRTLLRFLLREFGIRNVHEAATPESGFAEFNRRVPDLVLVDWCPEFDGVGLVRRIRTDKDSPYPQAPIIMISAFGETKRIYQAIDAGMNEYLVKPVSPNLLYVRIASVIDNPRPFIRAKSYTGPCRRRHDLPFAGKDRRRAGAATAPVAAPAAAESTAGEAARRAEAA
jgi:DNA-binding response OmpR family regulator